MRSSPRKKIPIGAISAGLGVVLALGLACYVLLTRPDATTYFAEAKRHLAEPNIPAATLALKNVLQLEPGHGQARFLLGRVLVQTGQGAAALKELERAEELGVESIAPFRLQALLLEGRHAEVFGALAVDSRTENDPLLIRLRGEAALGLGKFDSAESAFERALSLSPEDLPSRLGLAEAALKNGNHQKAATVLASALEGDVLEPRVWLLLGHIERSTGNPEAALAAFEKAKTPPTTFDASIGIIRAKLDLEDSERALTLAEALVSRHPKNPMALYWRAVAAADAGEHETAVTAYRTLLGIAPNHPESLFGLGRLHLEQGQFSNAEAILRRLSKAVPEHVPTRKLLALAQLKLGKAPRVIETLNASKNHGLPEDPVVLALAAAAYRQLGDATRADGLLAQAVTLAPQEPTYRIERALGQLSAGHVDATVTSLHRVIDIDPGHNKAQALLVLAALAHGTPDVALEGAEHYVTQHPDQAFAHNLHARVLLGLGEQERARAALEKAVAIDPESPHSQVNLARLDRNSGAIDLAKARLYQAAKANPNHPGVLSELASLSIALGKPAEAIKWLERARAGNPRDLRSRVRLVPLYLAARQAEDALSAASEAHELAPKRPVVLMALARAHGAAGSLQAAIETARTLVQVAPTSPRAQVFLGSFLARANDIAGAARAAHAALKHEPRQRRALVLLGQLALKEGDVHKALQHAQTLATTHPDAPAGAALEGAAWRRGGDPAKALAAFRRAQALRPSGTYVIAIAHELRALGRDGEAQDQLSRWLASRPDDASVRQALAMTDQHAGDEREAAAGYEALLARGVRSVVAMNNLAWIYAPQAPKRALELAEDARALAPDHPAVLDTLGWMYFLNGQHERAIAALERSLDRRPEVPEHEYHLAAALGAIGEVDRAISLLTHALARDEPQWTTRSDAEALLAQFKRYKK